MHFTVSNLDKQCILKTFPQKVMVQGSNNNSIGSNKTLKIDRLWGFRSGSVTVQTT
jgi:hypothetical protein